MSDADLVTIAFPNGHKIVVHPGKTLGELRSSDPALTALSLKDCNTGELFHHDEYMLTPHHNYEAFYFAPMQQAMVWF